MTALPEFVSHVTGHSPKCLLTHFLPMFENWKKLINVLDSFWPFSFRPSPITIGQSGWNNWIFQPAGYNANYCKGIVNFWFWLLCFNLFHQNHFGNESGRAIDYNYWLKLQLTRQMRQPAFGRRFCSTNCFRFNFRFCCLTHRSVQIITGTEF